MELNEEEKKAIEWFKSDLEMTKEMGKKWGFQEEIKNNEIILNLVEKQQKEIKHQRQQRKYWRDIFYEQQKEIKELTLDLEEMTKSNNHKLENWVHKNILNSYISKHKIREKIEELKEIADEDNPDIYIKIDAYQELLEENINE
jgi:hypothetical protein